MELPGGSWSWERRPEELIEARIDAQGQAVDGPGSESKSLAPSNVGK